MALERTRIQNKLIEIGQQGAYYPVSYDTETKLASVDQAQPIEPSEVLCNEISANFGLPQRKRTHYRRERLGWRFELIIGFHCEVTFEAFEDSLLEDPPVLPRDPSCGHDRQVILELVEAPNYVHPYQQSSSAGSRVTLVFDARLSPS